MTDREQELYNQAFALQHTAETMIKAGHTGAVAASTRDLVSALVQAAKQMKGNSPGIAVLRTGPAVTWPEVHTITGAICSAM